MSSSRHPLLPHSLWAICDFLSLCGCSKSYLADHLWGYSGDGGFRGIARLVGGYVVCGRTQRVTSSLYFLTTWWWNCVDQKSRNQGSRNEKAERAERLNANVVLVKKYTSGCLYIWRGKKKDDFHSPFPVFSSISLFNPPQAWLDGGVVRQ